jgi:hypothetical protein
MSRIQRGSLLRLKRKAGPDVWVFRWYDETNGTRTYRKRTLGTVVRYGLAKELVYATEKLRLRVASESG